MSQSPRNRVNGSHGSPAPIRWRYSCLNPLVIGSMVLTSQEDISAAKEAMGLNPLVIGSMVLTLTGMDIRKRSGSSQSPRNRVNGSHNKENHHR